MSRRRIACISLDKHSSLLHHPESHSSTSAHSSFVFSIAGKWPPLSWTLNHSRSPVSLTHGTMHGMRSNGKSE